MYPSYHLNSKTQKLHTYVLLWKPMMVFQAYCYWWQLWSELQGTFNLFLIAVKTSNHVNLIMESTPSEQKSWSVSWPIGWSSWICYKRSRIIYNITRPVFVVDFFFNLKNWRHKHYMCVSQLLVIRLALGTDSLVIFSFYNQLWVTILDKD